MTVRKLRRAIIDLHEDYSNTIVSLKRKLDECQSEEDKHYLEIKIDANTRIERDLSIILSLIVQ